MTTIALAPASAAARAPAPRLVGLRCVPANAASCHSGVKLTIGQQLQLRGRQLYRGMRVTFRWPTGALATQLRRARPGWVARVPAGTRLGHATVAVRDRAGRRSNLMRIVVLPTAARERVLPGALPPAFAGYGIWIWQLAHTQDGDVEAIAAKAQASGFTTLFIKSSDGTAAWAQFTPELVQAFHAHGLRACAWQFVYGAEPVTEARRGAAAAAAGADCLVIDAESKYEGRYASAQRYMQALRAAVGPDYPVGLTSFPYVDYHPGLPFSVFLGPGGAQANLPQVYWKDIGNTVDAVSAHAFVHNRIYGVPLSPLGQAYDAPPAADIRRFRALWAGYGAAAISWWSWQAAAGDRTFSTLAEPAPPPLAVADPGWPVLAKGKKGDEVVWLQQHLASSDPSVPVDGKFGDSTDTALRSWQSAHALPVTGKTDPATWQGILALPVRAVDWTAER